MSIYPNKDIARTEKHGCGGLVIGVVPESPADDAGFTPGCRVTAVDGKPVRDIIDWRWLTAEDEITVSYIDTDGDSGEIDLWREEGEPWGFEFDGLVFDGVKQCRNACTFCFMRQLPHGMRQSLSVRDDDYRLSFLCGTFVTLTNVTEEDEKRIIEQRISPLRVSLQVFDKDIRCKLIGKHAAHGIEVLDRLLDAGIQFHAQIVLVPGANDGAVLEETLEWAYARPGILGIGIVPLGYTKHQTVFNKSFNDPAEARGVLELIEPFQARALSERGCVWVYAADEFYSNAYGEALVEQIPHAEFYEDFEMFEDGIGIIRTTIDDWESASQTGSIAKCADALRSKHARAVMIAGCAQENFIVPLVKREGIQDCFEPLFVRNEFFGGNVDVTGLLVGADVVETVKRHRANHKNSKHVAYLIPNVVFNDDGLTLDDMTLYDMEKQVGCTLYVVSCSPVEYFNEILHAVNRRKPAE